MGRNLRLATNGKRCVVKPKKAGAYCASDRIFAIGRGCCKKSEPIWAVSGAAAATIRAPSRPRRRRFPENRQRTRSPRRLEHSFSQTQISPHGVLIIVCRTIVSKIISFKSMKSSVLVKFGNKVQKERKRLGLSQEELAAKAGVHRTYIGMIERAEKNITLENIEKIAKALSLSLPDIFTDF